MTQDRIEQILHQYTEPMPEIHYFCVPMRDDGEAGVIEVRRDATKAPYRVRRDIGRLEAGDMFVRHGSQTDPPTERELEALMAEGERARSEWCSVAHLHEEGRMPACPDCQQLLEP